MTFVRGVRLCLLRINFQRFVRLFLGYGKRHRKNLDLFISSFTLSGRFQAFSKSSMQLMPPVGSVDMNMQNHFVDIPAKHWKIAGKKNNERFNLKTRSELHGLPYSNVFPKSCFQTRSQTHNGDVNSSFTMRSSVFNFSRKYHISTGDEKNEQ